MTQPIRVGLIGCGDISPSHLKSYAACGIELVALCDVDRARAEKRRAEYGTPETRIVSDHRALLAMEEIDFVTVATPVAYHAPLTIDALRAGKHVACEKPSTLSLAENAAIVAEARQAGKKVIFFSSRNRWGMSTLAKHYIDDGDLGEIYRVNVQFYRRRGRPGVDVIPDAHWFTNEKLAGGGVIMDLGQYYMDQVLHLVGWPRIETVSATTHRAFPNALPPEVPFDVEEHCTFFARCRPNITLTFDIAWISNHSSYSNVTILGDKGGIKMDSQTPFAFYSDKGGPWHWMNTTTEWSDKTNSNDHIYQDFMQAIRGNDLGIGTTPEEALAITELTQMVLLSAKRNAEVTREVLS